MSPLRRAAMITSGAVIAMAVYLLVFATPPGPRSLRAFDPDRTAALEVDTWQASKRLSFARPRADSATRAATRPDWAEVSRLLLRSYRSLRAAVQPEARQALNFTLRRSPLITHTSG